jgi:hypothetical protein
MDDKKLLCPICGQPTRVYMGNARKDLLCGAHANALKSGEIILDERGLFVDSKTCKVLNRDYIETKVEDKKTEGIVKCIACGKETKPGFLFCTGCYKKYNDKKLLVEITNCKEITILDDSYEGKYTCTDGHIVKSKSEMIIDNWLFDKGIPHAYEKRLPIDADESHDLHPDFYLPGYGDDPDDIYIEYWGYNESNIKYTESKNYKLKEYKKQKVTVICLEEKDMMDINASMNRKLKFYTKGTINE